MDRMTGVSALVATRLRRSRAAARSYAELSSQGDLMLMAFIMEVVEDLAGPLFSTLAATTKLVPCRMLGRQFPRVGKTTDWRAGCGKSASPVRREGEARASPYPYQ